MKIAIVNYGAGNVQSILFALQRLGHKAIVTDDCKEIQQADKVIFPGVGEAGSAMRKLKEKGLHTLIPTLKQPVLGICMGMQLLCKHSQEGNTPGLGVFEVDVIRFSDRVKVPQVGWNTIYNLKSALFKGIDEKDYLYLVHSYYVRDCKYTIALTDYELPYSSALQKANFYGVQFHPEKSGSTGEKILANFLKL